MASTYSSNLKIELMSTGENSGTWGNVTNTNLGTALEQAVVGYGNPDYLSDANLTISITNSNAAQAARALVLNVTSSFGSLSTTRELVVPTIQKQYIVQNNTTGGQSITVKTSAGTGITVPNGRKAHLYVNGTDVIQMFDFVDINGGTIDGTAIGGAAAAAAAFTTLTASGATTLNGAVALGDAVGDLITVPGTINSNLLFTDATYDIGASGATRPRDMFLSRNLTVGGTLTLAGGVNLNGNVTVGDSSADTLTINATITSNLLFTDNTYDIGASGATRPRNLFLAGNATIGGAQTLTGALTVDSTTDSTSATTGSIQTDGGVGIAKALFVGTTVTVNGGTANGVAYLNGSKVLTTGSALTFDGSNVGIGTSSPGSKLDVVQAGAATVVAFGKTNVAQFLLGFNGTSNNYLDGDNNIFRSGNGTEGMRLTSTGLGIGTSSPSARLHVYTATSGTFTAPNAQVGTNSNAPSFSAQVLAIYPNELDTDYLSAYNTGGGNNNGASFVIANAGRNGTSGTVKLVMGLDAPGGATVTAAIGTASNHALTFGTNSAERMRLDSSGNLGLGVTPSAWGSVFKSFDISQAAISGTGGGALVESGNAYFNGTSWLYKVTGTATRVELNAGASGAAWYTAPSGTAGNAISFSQVMTLDASGNLGVGTTSPGYQGSKLTSAVSGSGTALYLSSNGSGTVNLVAGTYGDIWTNGAPATIQFIDNGNFSAHIAFRTKNSGAAANVDAERMRLDSSGNLLLGATSFTAIGSPGKTLLVSPPDPSSGDADIVVRAAGAWFRAQSTNAGVFGGLQIYNNSGTEVASVGVFGSTTALQLNVNGSERARIDSSGNLLIGTTSTIAGARMSVVGNVQDTLVRLQNQNATAPGGLDVHYSGAATNNADNWFYLARDSSATRFYVQSNGGIANYQGNDVNLSDRREKTNFAPAKSYLETICAIPVQTFNYIDQNMEDDGGLTLGVVAQDVQAVAPELVMESNWGTQDDPKMRLSIYQTDLQYALMKAIQELKAEFDAYKAANI